MHLTENLPLYFVPRGTIFIWFSHRSVCKKHAACTSSASRGRRARIAGGGRSVVARLTQSGTGSHGSPRQATARGCGPRATATGHAADPANHGRRGTGREPRATGNGQRATGHGARCRKHGARCREHGSRCREHGPRVTVRLAGSTARGAWVLCYVQKKARTGRARLVGGGLDPVGTGPPTFGALAPLTLGNAARVVIPQHGGAAPRLWRAGVGQVPLPQRLHPIEKASH